jgi:hypothetical protein
LWHLYCKTTSSFHNVLALLLSRSKAAVGNPSVLSYHYSKVCQNTSYAVKLASYLKYLAQHAKHGPRFEGLLKSATAFYERGVAGTMDPTPESKSEKPEKSYLTAAVESTFWGGSRSSTPKPASATPRESSGLKNQHGEDHTRPSWRGLSSKRYPPDCPPVNARWFYAVDVELAPNTIDAFADFINRFPNGSRSC